MDIENVEPTVEEQVASEQAGTPPVETPPAAPAATPGSEPAAEVLDPEAQLAAEALAATEEQAPVAPEGVTTVPVSVVAELRAERRENRQAIETLNAKLAEMTKPPEPVVELSPLEKWVAENPEDAEVTSPPATVQLAEKKWQAQEAKRQAEQQAQEDRKAIGVQSYTRAKSELTDFDQIWDMGNAHLTAGDRLDISLSKDPAKEIYKRCIERTLKSGTPDAAVMRQHLQAKLAKAQQSGPKPPVTPTVTQGTRTPAAPRPRVAEASERPMNPRLAQIYATFGM